MSTFPGFQWGRISAAFFALGLAAAVSAQTPAKPDPAAKPAVTGKFTGNGKPAALKFVIVEEHEPFGDEPAFRMLFTEKDPAKSKKPSFDAMFGELGCALSLSLDYKGGIFGCEVWHSAHQKQGFSSVGRSKTTDFKIADGNVSGHVSTGGEQDAFGEKWDVDLTFTAAMPEKLRNPAATPPKKPTATETDDDKADDADGNAPKSGPAISAHKLPIPKDATGVEFKQIVGQIAFSSPQTVAAVTKELSYSLKQQGWKDGAGSLVGKTNSILKCEQGAASLTVMIQPAGTGSSVKIFTEGLDWSGGDDAKASGIPKDPEDAADDIEAEARKQINDALKLIPK